MLVHVSVRPMLNVTLKNFKANWTIKNCSQDGGGRGVNKRYKCKSYVKCKTLKENKGKWPWVRQRFLRYDNKRYSP